MEKTLYIDAEGCILGRLASVIAKRLLEGYTVFVVNAEKAIVSGKPKMVIEAYKKLFEVTTHRNPERSGIRRRRMPSAILKETVRGMLPYRKLHGRQALKKLKVYEGIPEELAGKNFIKIPEASASKLQAKYITLKELAKELGWRG